MLVLSRFESESIYIGDSIRVMVVRIEGGKVRLGIDAPRDVVIVREELIAGGVAGAAGRAAVRERERAEFERRLVEGD